MALGAVSSSGQFYGTMSVKGSKSAKVAERGVGLRSREEKSQELGNTYTGGKSLLDVYSEMKSSNVRQVGSCGNAEKANAVSVVTRAEAGEFIGVIMVSEEGESTVYGMTAFLIESSTPENPIVQIRSNLGGERTYYNVEVNKVNPEFATQLEMFALLSYTDKMGLTDGGAFGSFQKLQVYAMNAYQNGYCDNPSGVDTFLNETFDWKEIIGDIMKDYMDAQLQSQYEDCENLLDYFEREKSEDENYVKFIQDKMVEILEKIENGEREKSYQIGSQSFTEKEWDKFLENFDSIQEVLKELMRERLEKKEEEALEKAREEEKEKEELLVAESTSCMDSTDPEGEDIRYITWYTTDGIFCRKAGQTEGYEWKIDFENTEQYEKVMALIAQFPDDYNMRFAAHENFWKDFLNNKMDMVSGSQDNGIDMDKVIEVEVATIPEAGVSFYYNLNTGEMECVDDTNTQPGRQIKWSKKISMEEYDKCHELFDRSRGERTWEYTYGEYLGYEKFWDMFLNNEIDLANVEQTDLLQRLREGKV